MKAKRASCSIDFDRVNAAALGHSRSVMLAFLPNGRPEGHEWVAPNPTRADNRPGSFKINMVTGRWADFATKDSDGDLVSLVAYLCTLSQRSAAICLAEALGITPYDR